MKPLIEEVENFWDKRPCNIKHSKKEIGTLDYFEDVSKKKYFVEKHILSFTDFDRWKNKKVLEIGCGIGTTAVSFAQKNSEYTTIELSKKSLEIAKHRFDTYKLKGEFFHGNAEELSKIIPIKTFDLIYSFGVIHHTPNPDKVLSEIKKYMDNNSILKIMVYAKNSWKNFLIESGMEQPEAQYGCPIAYTYTKNDIYDLLKDFKILSIYQDHIFPYQVEPYKRGEYIKQPWFEEMPRKMFNALQKKLGWHMLVTAKLK